MEISIFTVVRFANFFYENCFDENLLQMKSILNDLSYLDLKMANFSIETVFTEKLAIRITVTIYKSFII